MAKPRRTTNPRLFGALPARRRRDAFIALRWRIFRTAPTYGGLFTSHQHLVDPERPEAPNRWMDILFLGQDGRTIWNAEIVTADLAFEDAVTDLAWERTRALLTEAEFAEEFRMESEPIFRGGVKLWRVRFPEPRPHAALGGLTLRAYEERLKARIRAQEPPPIHESFALDHSFAYGAGLTITVDAPRLDQAVIEQAILRFRALGETNWTNPDPSPLECLICEDPAGF